ncbi:DM13 domain-containing protein [Candidatus Nitrosotenuis chungbukensis]|uniref:DM13 domain-containing protein n=1 Tax=Candidatus Nitrosotenuis chungbukensis TaxID=1353246 RepID=UPI0005B2DE69|nr:DM13 domain-containing protein [Candidatus Nitrosotenuis chungbukensis]
MNKKLVIGAVLAFLIPAIVYASSPLFFDTTIDEEIPSAKINALQTQDAETVQPVELALGIFVGVGDGIHNAEGTAKVLSIDDAQFLRLEDFKATNGPDLHVYLATDDKATNYVDLGSLKANVGNQNYRIPEGTDLSKYDTALVWCKQFSVLFGHANLS